MSYYSGDRCGDEQLFTPEQIKQFSQLKRFSEWMQADSKLRAALDTEEGLSTEQEQWMRKIGIEFEIEEISFFWKHPFDVNAYVTLVTKDREDEAEDHLKELVVKYPLLKLWAQYMKTRCDCTEFLEQWGHLASPNEKFNAWRKRRINSAKSELGFFGMRIGHPVFAFELNAGCSVGCWFCSFATEKLSRTFNYPEKREEALSIVRQCGELFGKEMAMMALPYYRTEPHDNPHYLDFLKDFEKETGAVLCTSTAVCHDFKWIRDLLDYYQKREDGRIYYWPRLSILTLDILRKIHESFTPMEVKDIELLIQVKDNVRPKVTGGRILEEQAGLRSVEDFDSGDRISLLSIVPQGTIACVSGFNINLANRTIMLFSPCYTSAEWPHGFRVFGETSYTDENDFAAAVTELAERCMYLSPPKDKPLRFRDDMIFRPTDLGFDLATAHQLHHFKGKSKCGPLGELIAEGTHTYEEISAILLKEHKINPIIVRAAVQQLYDDGLIDEVY